MAENVRPHRMPPLPADCDGECIAWKCAACGEWIGEFDSEPRSPCPVEWRVRYAPFRPSEYP